MSFPNMPGIPAEYLTDFDGAIRLLLTSIDLEEESLTRLINAEREMRLHAPLATEANLDMSATSKSADAAFETITQLRTLLQMKRRNVCALTGGCREAPTPCRACRVCGTLTACVRNPGDAYHGQSACLSVDTGDNTGENSELSYTVSRDMGGLWYTAVGAEARVCKTLGDALVFRGQGRLRRYCPWNEGNALSAGYELILRGLSGDCPEMRMRITGPRFRHDSGYTVAETPCELRVSYDSGKQKTGRPDEAAPYMPIPAASPSTPPPE